jgi:hypothetical protein
MQLQCSPGSAVAPNCGFLPPRGPPQPNATRVDAKSPKLRASRSLVRNEQIYLQQLTRCVVNRAPRSYAMRPARRIASLAAQLSCVSTTTVSYATPTLKVAAHVTSVPRPRSAFCRRQCFVGHTHRLRNADSSPTGQFSPVSKASSASIRCPRYCRGSRPLCRLRGILLHAGKCRQRRALQEAECT